MLVASIPGAGAKSSGFPGNVTFKFRDTEQVVRYKEVGGDIWVQQGGQKISGAMILNYDRPELENPTWQFMFTGTVVSAGSQSSVRIHAVPGNSVSVHYPGNVTGQPRMNLSSLGCYPLFINPTTAEGPLGLTFSNVPDSALSLWPSSQTKKIYIGNTAPAGPTNNFTLGLGPAQLRLTLTAEGERWSLSPGYDLGLSVSGGTATLHTFTNLPAISLVHLSDDDGDVINPSPKTKSLKEVDSIAKSMVAKMNIAKSKVA